MLHNKRSHRNEKPMHHNKEWPPLAKTRESPRVATKKEGREGEMKERRKEGKNVKLSGKHDLGLFFLFSNLG